MANVSEFLAQVTPTSMGELLRDRVALEVTNNGLLIVTRFTPNDRHPMAVETYRLPSAGEISEELSEEFRRESGVPVLVDSWGGYADQLSQAMAETRRYAQAMV